jgi:hypothetical protein
VRSTQTEVEIETGEKAQMNRHQFIHFITAAIAVSTATASVSDVVYTAHPDCKNPEHPAGTSKRMLFLTRKDHALVFGCQAYWGKDRVQSLQVKIDPHYKQKIRHQLAAQGRLLAQPLVIMRTT